MSRSVSTHPNAVATVYLNPEIEEDGWREFIQTLQQILSARFPSLGMTDRWAGREDHVILENAHAEVSVSEYCGLVAVCLAERAGYTARFADLARAWCNRVCASFTKTLEKSFASSVLQSAGRASNGEQFFTRSGKTLQESCITSKEGQLW